MTRCYYQPSMETGRMRCGALRPNLLVSDVEAVEHKAMDYNRLKIRVLSLFGGSRELESEEVRKLLRESTIELSDKAVKMALMRYTRQGLLARGKKMGVFHYRLTEKGKARLDWLSRPR